MQASARIENRDEQLEGDRGVDRGAAFHDLGEGHLALEGDNGAHLLFAHVPDRLVDFAVNLLAIEQGLPLLLAFPVEDVEALCDHIIILSHGKSICQDTPEKIRKAATKHVWHVSEKRQKELTSPYYILRREQIDGEAYLRVLSNEEQPGKSIQPTLEDGYINMIRGIR